MIKLARLHLISVVLSSLTGHGGRAARYKVPSHALPCCKGMHWAAFTCHRGHACHAWPGLHMNSVCSHLLMPCRLGAAPELHPLESSLSMDSIAALRVMYGLHTYLDDMSGLTGPQGLSTYSEFLEGFERIVMRRLSLDDVFMYLERVAGPITDPRAIFILIDDLDSALPRVSPQYTKHALSIQDGSRTLQVLACLVLPNVLQKRLGLISLDCLATLQSMNPHHYHCRSVGSA